MDKKTYIKEWCELKNMTLTAVATIIGITRSALSQQVARPSYSSLCAIAAALDVEPWQLLAPPSVVEELKQARATKEAGGAPLVGVVRLGRQTFTANSLDELRAVVRTIEDQAAHADTSNG